MAGVSVVQRVPLLRLGKVQALPGHLYGLPQRCVRAQLWFRQESVPSIDPSMLSDPTLKPMPPGCELSLAPVIDSPALDRNRLAWLGRALAPLNEWLVRLQVSAEWPVCSGLLVEQVLFSKGRQADIQAVVAVPTMLPAILAQRLAATVKGLLARLDDTQEPKPTTSALVEALARYAFPDTNTLMFVSAAYQQDVPVRFLTGKTMQYGWGARARWMDSSFTDGDSAIAAHLVRNKVSANALLKRAGVPVAEQRVVDSADAAALAARAIGYPVVIKPADLDGGQGVEAGLQDETSLRAAFARASKHGRRLILEKHIPGRDYRLSVFFGRFAFAAYREPAGVWGDGVSSIRLLINTANTDPARSERPGAAMKPLVVNEEALELLAEQGLALESVASRGTFVPLRRAANVSSGGRAVDVSDQIHPDNVALAERVARLCRLQLVGIDFITRDLSRSWREVGGAICEVNGQPQFTLPRPETPARLFNGLLGGDGRIPVAVMLGDLPFGPWVQALRETCAARGVTLALSLRDGRFLGSERLSFHRESAFTDVQTFLMDSAVDAIVVVTSGKEWLTTGLPVDRFSLVVAGPEADARVMRALGGSEPGRLFPVPELPNPDEPDRVWVNSLVDALVGGSLTLGAAG